MVTLMWGKSLIFEFALKLSPTENRKVNVSMPSLACTCTINRIRLRATLPLPAQGLV